MNIEPNTKNAALASAVNSRINADAMMVKAKAAGLRLAGLGTVLFLAGAGLGVAFFGYSYMLDSTHTTERVGEAMAKALERTTLKTTGSVGIDPSANRVALAEGSTVDIDPRATVRLDANGQIVKLDPNAKIEVITPVQQFSRPNPGQLAGTVPSSQNNHPIVTGFTVFKSVRFGKGVVHTGWKFRSNEEPAPHYQYCYYGQGMEEAVEVTVTLAVNGVLNSKAKRGAVDNTSAAESCIWFDGAPTRATASTY